MKVLFIYPVPPAELQIPRFQQGVGVISAVLRRAGHETRLVRVSRPDESALARAMEEYTPELVSLSVTSDFFELSRQISAWVAEKYGAFVVWGGVHPTLRPEESIQAPGVSAVCRGEGEAPMLELCAALRTGRSPEKIQNLWVKNGNGKITKNGIRPLITDLDSLPYPDREIFDFGQLLKILPEAEFMGSRGCPYACAYCVNHALKELYKDKGPYVRYRSVDNLLGEIAEVTQKYPAVKFLGFHDDTFTLNPKWMKEFCEKYAARFKIPFWCNATARSITEEKVKLLKAAGCYEIRMGVESGNERIRREVLKKDVADAVIEQAFRTVREAGIMTYAFNMVGLPYETAQTMRDTVGLNRKIRPDTMFCSVFQPYPGTELYEVSRREGWLTGKAVQSYFADDYVLNQPGLDAGEVVRTHKIFRDLVRWPHLTALIRAMDRTKIGAGKTLLNVWRRAHAKVFDALNPLFGGKLRPWW